MGTFRVKSGHTDPLNLKPRFPKNICLALIHWFDIFPICWAGLMRYWCQDHAQLFGMGTGASRFDLRLENTQNGVEKYGKLHEMWLDLLFLPIGWTISTSSIAAPLSQNWSYPLNKPKHSPKRVGLPFWDGQFTCLLMSVGWIAVCKRTFRWWNQNTISVGKSTFLLGLHFLCQ